MSPPPGLGSNCSMGALNSEFLILENRQLSSIFDTSEYTFIMPLIEAELEFWRKIEKSFFPSFDILPIINFESNFLFAITDLFPVKYREGRIKRSVDNIKMLIFCSNQTEMIKQCLSAEVDQRFERKKERSVATINRFFKKRNKISYESGS